MGAPSAGRLVDQWLTAFLQVPDDRLRSASDWGAIPHDQELFQKILSDNPDLEPYILKDLTQTLHSGPEGGGAAFIEQVIRAVTGDDEERRRIIRWNVAEALWSYGLEIDPALTASRNEYKLETRKIVTALYEGLLGRPPDERQLERHTEAFTRSGLAYVVRDLIAGADFRSRFLSLNGEDRAERSRVSAALPMLWAPSAGSSPIVWARHCGSVGTEPAVERQAGISIADLECCAG